MQLVKTRQCELCWRRLSPARDTRTTRNRMTTLPPKDGRLVVFAVRALRGRFAHERQCSSRAPFLAAQPRTEANLRIGAQARLGQECPRSLARAARNIFRPARVGYSIELIASHTKTSASAVRRAVGQSLAKRRLDAPEDYARLQVARLIKALRCADVSLEEGDLKAIAPFLKVVRELNLHHDVNSGRMVAHLAVGSRADGCAARTYARSEWLLRECSRTKKVARKRS